LIIKIGDLVETYDNSIGMIVEKFDAADHLAIPNSRKTSDLFNHLRDIVMYKVLIHGTLCYINETNIKGIVKCGKKEEKL
jgi:hypothetical protein